MTAPTRRRYAANVFVVSHTNNLWYEAVKIRQTWLDYGLSTRPADRTTAVPASRTPENTPASSP